MARTVRMVYLRPQRTDARPEPLFRNYPAIGRRYVVVDYPRTFEMDCNQMLSLAETASGRLVFIPYEWKSALEWDPEMEENGEWEDIDWVAMCWKITDIFEQLSSAISKEDRPAIFHPNLLGYLGSDPWTRFPLFEKPPNAMPLGDFLRETRDGLYSTSPAGQYRIHPGFRPVVYQWVLHIVSALSILHDNGIMVGAIDKHSLLLASEDKILPSPTQTVTPPRIYLADFHEAAHHSTFCGGQLIRGVRKPCEYYPTLLRDVEDPTQDTDIFLVGVLIHELMTGERLQDASSVHRDEISFADGPRLEKEHLGDITKKCWDREYENVGALKNDLVQYLTAEGWEIDGDDNLQNIKLD